MESTIAGRFEANLESIKKLLEDAGTRLGYLFGSAARGFERRDSDLDVAILLDEKVPEHRFGEIRLRLLTHLVGLTHTNDVDLVILNIAPPLLAFEVISSGRLFLGSEPDRVRFEVRSIKHYIDTRPLRDRSAASLMERIRLGSRNRKEGPGKW
jgi:hypothetical protein